MMLSLCYFVNSENFNFFVKYSFNTDQQNTCFTLQKLSRTLNTASWYLSEGK